MLVFLSRVPNDPLHRVASNSVRKIIRLDSTICAFELTFEKDHFTVKTDPDQLERVIKYVEDWFDLETDIGPFQDCLHEVPVTKPLSIYSGMRILAMPDLFEALSWSIIGQQINLKFAHKIKSDLIHQYGERYDFGGDELWVYPTSNRISHLTVEELMRIKFSRRKAEYLIGIAEAVDRGGLCKTNLISFKNTNEMVAELMTYRGIGRWTANYVVMKTLRRPDCIPWGDTGIQAGVKKLMGLDRKPTEPEIGDFYAPFPGYESYLTFYLWRSLY
jgi:DNA-3-methyladenine glycosylase II